MWPPERDEHTPEPEAEAGAASSARAATLRERLVQSLWMNGTLASMAVDAAMRAVPRHLFLPTTPLEDAYADVAVPTHWDGDIAVSSASQPAIVAVMLQQLQLQPGMRVLEIGAGTGYNAALLAELVGPGGSVTTLDVDQVVAAEAREHLTAAGYPSVCVHAADGRDGWPEGAPYDRIILTVGTDDVTPAWFDQLVEGGLLVLPLRLGGTPAIPLGGTPAIPLGGTPAIPLGGTQASVAFRKPGGALTSESLACCGFMPLRGTQQRPELVALPKNRIAQGEGISPLREPLAALLATRARVRLSRRLDPPLLQYLGLLGARIVTLYPHSQDARRRRVRYAIYAEDADGPSLVIFSNTLPLSFAFGSRAAECLVEDAAASLPKSLLPVDQWRVECRLRPAADTVPVPPGAIRLTRRHAVFDVWAMGDGV